MGNFEWSENINQKKKSINVSNLDRVVKRMNTVKDRLQWKEQNQRQKNNMLENT